MKVKNLPPYLGAGLVLALSCFPSICAGAIYSFDPISTNSGVSNANTVGDQVTMEVFDQGFIGGRQIVDFKFVNHVGLASSVTDIYFQDGPLLGARLVLDQSAGVSFSDIGVSPGNLPGGKTLSPDFRTTAGFSADADNSPTGLNGTGDWVTFRFTLLQDRTYAEVLQALEMGYTSPGAVWNEDGSDKPDGPYGLRIGIHVSSIGSAGKSDSFINGPRQDTPIAPVPEPGTLAIWSVGAGIALLFGTRLRRKIATSD